MWAMMQIFRVFASEYWRSTSSLCFLSVYLHAKRGTRLRPPSSSDPLPAVMRERFVGLRHLVRVFPLLHGGAPVVGGVQPLRRELLGHACLRPPARRADHPAPCPRRAAGGPPIPRALGPRD